MNRGKFNVIVEGIQYTEQVSSKSGRVCRSEDCKREILIGENYVRVAKADATMVEKRSGRGSRRKISGPRAMEQGHVQDVERIEIFHEDCFRNEFCE